MYMYFIDQYMHSAVHDTREASDNFYTLLLLYYGLLQCIFIKMIACFL